MLPGGLNKLINHCNINMCCKSIQQKTGFSKVSIGNVRIKNMHFHDINQLRNLKILSHFIVLELILSLLIAR